MGSVCINSQSRCDRSLQYPILNKLMKFQPDKQFPLVKPHSHQSMIEETYEMNYLEIILNFQEFPKKQKQELKCTSIIPVEGQKKEKCQEQQVTTIHDIQDYNLEQQQQIEKCLKIKRSVTQNSNHPDQFDDCSVILNKNQAGSDTQTIRSILKTNKSKSHKSAPKVTSSSSQKKVSFEPRLLKQKNRNFFM